MSVIETIKKRVSCRTYQEKQVDQDAKILLENFLKTNTKVPFGSRLRFRLLDLSDMERSELKGLGTYGVIKGASLFIAGAVTKGPMAMEDFGYAMERNVLEATELGLGTCWLGGTFNRSGFAERMELAGDEVLPAITPVGYASAKKSVTDRLFRFTAASHTRKSWQEMYFHGDLNTPLTILEAGAYGDVLEAVRLAPSASNKQPWRVMMEEEGSRFHFFLKRTPVYDKLFQGISLQNIDMGIAISHFEMAAAEAGLNGAWKIQEPDIAANGAEYIVTWNENG